MTTSGFTDITSIAISTSTIVKQKFLFLLLTLVAVSVMKMEEEESHCEKAEEQQSLVEDHESDDEDDSTIANSVHIQLGFVDRTMKNVLFRDEDWRNWDGGKIGGLPVSRMSLLVLPVLTFYIGIGLVGSHFYSNR
jgi:hypothetical protein